VIETPAGRKGEEMSSPKRLRNIVVAAQLLENEGERRTDGIVEHVRRRGESRR